MDSAFISFGQIIEKVLDIKGNINDEDNGIHFYIDEIEIGTPVELDIVVDENGKVTIWAIPPLYRVDSSFRPSYHNITLKAKTHLEDGNRNQ
jgi:hypothetical protein